MNSTLTRLIGLLLCTMPMLAMAEENKGTTDEETGLSTRTWLKEQAESTNRGEVEPYSAESAGKAYRSYTESIGAKDQKAPTSQVSTIQTN